MILMLITFNLKRIFGVLYAWPTMQKSPVRPFYLRFQKQYLMICAYSDLILVLNLCSQLQEGEATQARVLDLFFSFYCFLK